MLSIHNSGVICCSRIICIKIQSVGLFVCDLLCVFSFFQKIVDTYLGQFIKKLSPDQYAILWDKSSSSNPLWLRIACEELRVFGEFQSIKEFMEKMKDGLPEYAGSAVCVTVAVLLCVRHCGLQIASVLKKTLLADRCASSFQISVIIISS